MIIESLRRDKKSEKYSRFDGLFSIGEIDEKYRRESVDYIEK